MRTRKKDLIKENQDLRAELMSIKKHNARCTMIDTANLPPCQSQACYSCRHIVLFTNGDFTHVLGCGKDLSCKDYELDPTNRAFINPSRCTPL